MDRRTFLRRSMAATVGAGTLTSARMASAKVVDEAQPGDGPYGSLEGVEPDENGLVLPEGFTSRIVAIGGDPVGDTGYEWHLFPDGAATFDDGEGGWYYTCNSEVFNFLTPGEQRGGVSATPGLVQQQSETMQHEFRVVLLLQKSAISLRRL